MKRQKRSNRVLNLAFVVGAAAVVLLGCNAKNKITPTDPVTPLSLGTPTPNLTPVCGMTPVTIPIGYYGLADSGVHVIQNTAQWNAFIQPTGLVILNLTPVPTPTPPPSPVDFAGQMIITAGVPQPCDNTSVAITEVCVGPTQVTIYVTYNTCVTCPICNMGSTYASIQSAVAVPQSSLPVSIISTYTSQ